MSNPKPQSRLHRALSRRLGMTVVVVLGVISITLALSYAMLRSQVTAVGIQSNLERRNFARQAAYAGISAALRSMHTTTWAGVDSTLERDLAEHQWFNVTFTTGDPALVPTDPDYAEYPFRVTLDSVGYAADPSHPDVQSSYRVRAVVELVREKLQDAPSGWAFVRNFTAYQFSGNASFVEVPVRVEGPLWIQGALYVGTDYPSDPTSRNQYYNDLTAMKNAGRGDYRPLSGPILTPFSKHTSSNRTFLSSGQQINLVDVPIATGAPAPYPTGATSYQLYAGGKVYEMPVLQSTYGGTLRGLTLAPDPLQNPLGMFLSSGTLYIDDNTTVNGMIVTTGSEPDVRIIGKNVVLQGQTLPLLDASTGDHKPHQLPAAIVKDDLFVIGDAQCKIRGTVVSYDEFSFAKGDTAANCDMQGRVICSKLLLYGRNDWDRSLLQWQTDYLSFTTQKLLAGGYAYFPEWTKAVRGLEPNPLLTIKPESTDIVHHWHSWGLPVYVPRTAAEGLRWNLIDWTDNPATP